LIAAIAAMFRVRDLRGHRTFLPWPQMPADYVLGHDIVERITGFTVPV